MTRLGIAVIMTLIIGTAHAGAAAGAPGGADPHVIIVNEQTLCSELSAAAKDYLRRPDTFHIAKLGAYYRALQYSIIITDLAFVQQGDPSLWARASDSERDTLISSGVWYCDRHPERKIFEAAVTVYKAFALEDPRKESRNANNR